MTSPFFHFVSFCHFDCFLNDFSPRVHTFSVLALQVLLWTSLLVINEEQNKHTKHLSVLLSTMGLFSWQELISLFVSLRPDYLFILDCSWAIVYKSITYVIFSRLTSFLTFRPGVSNCILYTAHLYLEVSLMLHTQSLKTYFIHKHPTHIHTSICFSLGYHFPSNCISCKSGSSWLSHSLS